MGTQFLIETRTMKFLVVLALVAAAYAAPEAEANAEAEPWYYSNYGYASPYYYSGYRYGYSPYYNWGYRGYWKRDAEAQPEANADAEAEPWWYSNWGYRSAYASPYWNRWGYGYSPYYNWGGYRYLWKRDAEAQPEADAEAEPWWYSHYGYGGYARAYACPYWNRWGYAYSPYYNWGGYRSYLWKRDAEAQPEADAEANPEAYWYGNWYGRRWGGWGYGYRPYGYGYYGRRWGWWIHHPPYSLKSCHPYSPIPFEFNVQFYPVAPW